MKKLLLIDGNSLLYRAFFALPPLTSNGRPTGALNGFFVMLVNAIKKYEPETCRCLL